MSRYPFSDRVDEYLSSMTAFSENEKSVDAARRHLRSMGRIFHQMKTERIIESDNPSQITVRDVRSYVERRRSGGVSDSTVKRDLDYLNGYLLYLDNDSAALFQEDHDKHLAELREESSAKALPRIIDMMSSPDDMDRQSIEAFSFIILVIVLGIRPEQLRKSYVVHGQDPGCILDYFIDYTDDLGMNVHRKLDLRRVPVVECYVKDPPIDMRYHNHTKRPMFPSRSPLFDFASPNDIRDMKHLVERKVGHKFDYRICQHLYAQMKEDDEMLYSHPSNVQSLYDPSFCGKGSFLEKVRGRLFH